MKIYRTILTLLLVLVCVGCTAEKQQKVEEKPTGMDAEYEEIRAITDIKEGQHNVYVIIKAWGNSYWDGILNGAADAGNDMGCNVYAGGVCEEDNGDRQGALIDQAVEMGADAIVLAPVNLPPVVNAIEAANEKNVPVIFVDTIIDTSKFEACYMTDNMTAGEMAAEEMLSKLKKMGKSETESLSVGIQAGSTSSQTIIDRIAGFMSYWTINAPENWKVLDDVKINNGDVELAEKYGDDLMNDYSDLSGIYSCNNGSTVGSVKSITSSGRNDVVLVGFDYSDEMQAMLKSGKYSVSTIVQRQYNMGYEGVQTAAKAEKPQLKFVDTGITLINQDNVFSDEIVKELEMAG